MRESWRGVKIREFEQLRAGPSTSLLRVSGKPGRWRSRPGERPILFTQAGSDVHRYSALPSPPDPKGLLRAAYSVPVQNITDDTVFALLTADGSMISLPAPALSTKGAPLAPPSTASAADPDPAIAEGVGDLEPEAPASDDLEPVQVEVDETASADDGFRVSVPFSVPEASAQDSGFSDEEREEVRAAAEAAAETARDEAQALQARIQELVAEVREAAGRLTETEARAEEAQRAAQAAREEAAQKVQATRQEAEAQVEATRQDAEAQAEAARQEAEARAEARRQEAEQQLQATREQAEREMQEARGQANQRIREAEMEAERLQTELYHTEAQLQALQAETDARVREAAEQADAAAEARFAATRVELQSEVAAAVAAQEALDQEAQFLRNTRAQIERELHDALDDVRKMRFERDELSRQAAAFDGVAIKARERALQAETGLQKAQATLGELQVWRGELERRLTATTSELGLARTTLAENDRELRRLRGEQAEAEARAELAEAQVRALQQRSQGGDQTTTTIERSELERLSQELAALRAEQVSSNAEGETTAQRILALESERDGLMQQASQLTARLSAGEGTLPQSGDGAAEETDLGTSADDIARVAELTRLAEQEAEDEAARELAEAGADDATAAF